MPANTKEALLDSAEHAARARGFDGFSYADLAAAVGIRKASIHYHFPTKADLSLALIERYHVTFKRHCAAIDETHAAAADRLAALAALYKSALNNGKTLCLCVSLTSSRESLSPEVLASIKTFRSMMIGWIASVFELGAADGTIKHISTPQGEARATLALFEGAHLAARAEEDVQLFDDATQTLLERCAQP